MLKSITGHEIHFRGRLHSRDIQAVIPSIGEGSSGLCHTRSVNSKPRRMSASVAGMHSPDQAKTTFPIQIRSGDSSDSKHRGKFKHKTEFVLNLSDKLISTQAYHFSNGLVNRFSCKPTKNPAEEQAGLDESIG